MSELMERAKEMRSRYDANVDRHLRDRKQEWKWATAALNGDLEKALALLDPNDARFLKLAYGIGGHPHLTLGDASRLVYDEGFPNGRHYRLFADLVFEYGKSKVGPLCRYCDEGVGFLGKSGSEDGQVTVSPCGRSGKWHVAPFGETEAGATKEAA